MSRQASPAPARRLRIAFLDSWPRGAARGSGTAVGISGLASGLERCGHRVIPILPRRRLRPLLLQRLVYNLEIPTRLRQVGVDLVVGFDIDGCFLPRRRGVRRVVSLKGVAADERRFESGFTGSLFALLAAVEGSNARRADRVVATSQHSRSAAIAAYRLDPRRTVVVPEGLDLVPWQSLERDGPLAKHLRPTVLSVARQYRRKNTGALLEALARLSAAHPDLALRVVGGGPELPRLQGQVRTLALESKVTLLGEVLGDDEVRREYLRAHIFCLPSLQEGFGIVFLEAMAAGLPIVASRSAAVPEVVPDGEVGLLVPDGEPAALAEMLDRLLGDPELRRRMGQRGRRRVRRYRWPLVARSFLDAVL